MYVYNRGNINSRSKGFFYEDWKKFNPKNYVNKNDLIIVDSYLVDSLWLNKIEGTVVCLDDYNRIIYPVDLVINPNIFGSDIDYSNQKAKVVGGKKYVILRSPFRAGMVDFINKIKPTLLITLGGSDYRNLNEKLIKICSNIKMYNIRVIAPSGLKNSFKEIVEIPYVNDEEMADEIINSDVIISACGQTLHEIASVNRPVIGILIDNDQVLNQKYYLNINFLKQKIFWDDDELEKLVSDELVRLSLKSERTKHFSQLNEFTFNGVDNILKEVLEL
jgi:spore coat polysaccharide biosynthesis predicted glycosyltransferase SpsG